MPERRLASRRSRWRVNGAQAGARGALTIEVAVSSTAARVFVLGPATACANGWLTRDKDTSWVYVKAARRVRLRFDGDLGDSLAPGSGLTPYDVIRLMDSEHRLNAVALNEALFVGTDETALIKAKRENPNVVGVVNVLIGRGHEINCQ
jgi:hypothetical protein